MGFDGSGSSGKRMRPLLGLLAYASITGEYAPALPGAAAVELGHNFSLIHDDIEDNDRERRHRATLWTLHGIPQAINTGDAVFVLSRIALHRLTELGLQRRQGAPPDAPLRRDVPGPLRGPVHRHLDRRARPHDDRGPLLRHDRAQDRRPHLGQHRGRRAPRHRRRGGHHPLPQVRLGPGPCLPAQRRRAGDLGPGAGDRQGADRPRQAQEDAPRHLRPRARDARRPGAPRSRLRPRRTRRQTRSPRRWRSSSGPAPRTTRAPRPGAGATRRSPSSTPPASSSPRRGPSSSRSCGA